MLASEKLYIVSRRSVLEHRINECLIYFSCWIKGNINAQYLPPFTPSPPSCAQQIQRRLMMHGECAYVDDWTCHWNRSIPFALCEIHMDRAPGPRSCVDTSSECAKLLWYPSWGGYCSVGFQQGKKGPFYLFSLCLFGQTMLVCTLLRQQPEVRASHTLLFWWHLNMTVSPSYLLLESHR